MKVESCSTKQAQDTLSFDQIRSAEGVYRLARAPSEAVRFLVLRRGTAQTVVLHYTPSTGALVPVSAELGWDKETFLKAPEQRVCFELKV